MNFDLYLKAWSFVSSIGSIAWSFSSNYSRRKLGQMSVESRVFYFVYVLAAVISRITLIELFVISLGQESFLWIYGVIIGHVIMVFLLDLWLNWAHIVPKDWFWWGKDCLIRAFSSIYLHFPVIEDKTQKEDLR